jgi:carbonic anhydrase/acetyltransferase-like protein (isoleucine patch superfamily)
VCHVEHDIWPLIIGNRVTIGHQVTLHGCVIEDDCLIGIGAIVLNGAKVGRWSIIAAGALVPEGMEVPPGSIVMGVPGKVRREVSEKEREKIARHASNYVRYREIYKEEEKS